MFKNLWNGLIDIIYPNVCLLCKKKVLDNAWPLCQDCLNQVEKNHPPFSGNNNFYFRCAFSACIYEGKIKELIHLFKYKGKIALVKPLTKILIDFVRDYKIPLNDFDLIMPIPLSSVRQREREYNQSELLAKGISAEFDLKLDANNLTRIKNTVPQITLSDKERWQNIKGAFSLKREKDITEKTVLLVDDLITTGATGSEAASVLKDAGAKEVSVLTLACTKTK